MIYFKGRSIFKGSTLKEECSGSGIRRSGDVVATKKAFQKDEHGKNNFMDFLTKLSKSWIAAYGSSLVNDKDEWLVHFPGQEKTRMGCLDGKGQNGCVSGRTALTCLVSCGVVRQR